jgi:hypothetical protein
VGTLAFFPWLRLAAPLRVGAFELVPYVRGQYTGPDAGAIDLVTAPYREVPDTPIREAVLLRLGENDLVADLDEKQLDAIFAFGEMIALAGLSRRRFFFHSGYSNRDHYRLVVQRFDEPGKGTLLKLRRRDGVNNVFVTAAVHRVPCPRHVHPEQVDLDVPLLEALVACRDHANAPDFVDSMITFNLANTDSSTMSPHVELVLMSGALEKVLGCRSGKDDDLARAFEPAIAPRQSVARPACPRLGSSTKFSKSTTVRDVWIRDLFVLRGDLAHGKVAQQYPSIWAVREHLLLASFIFPLVMKAQLTKHSLYCLSEEDRLQVDAFERLACARDLFTPTDKFRNRFPWNDILTDVEDEEIRRQTIAELERLDQQRGE